MIDRGRSDDCPRPLNNELIGDSAGISDQFIIGPKGNKVNVIFDEDGVTLFQIKNGLRGMFEEDSITLSMQMLKEIYRRAVGANRTSEVQEVQR